MVPPYVPNVKSSMDLGHIDSCFKNEPIRKSLYQNDFKITGDNFQPEDNYEMFTLESQKSYFLNPANPLRTSMKINDTSLREIE